MIMTRKNILSVKRIVVKIGTSSLILPNGKINLSNIDELAFVLSDLNNKGYEVILVTSGRLGSINHTLLSLEALKHRGLSLHALVYNLKDESKDPLISKDTADYLKAYLAKHFPDAQWIDLEKFN